MLLRLSFNDLANSEGFFVGTGDVDGHFSGRDDLHHTDDEYQYNYRRTDGDSKIEQLHTDDDASDTAPSYL